MTLSAGTRLGPYEILSPLGAGGMGEVYRARDTKLGREVAIKVLPEALNGDPERLARFEREARSLAAVNHPNIVTIYAVEEAGDVRLLAMELVEGKTLDLVTPSGGLPLPRFFEIAVPLADALSAAHERGIIHRDLKPGNVMLTNDGRIKVLDFGLAKLDAPVSDPNLTDMPTESRVQLTGEGVVFGTVAYMSPEQARGGKLDARSDVFSLGIVLYEMLTGARPFTGVSSVDLISSILRDQPSPVTDVRADLPPHIARILRRCLEKNPRDRYQTSRDVFNELRDLQGETSATPAKAAAVTPRAARAPARTVSGEVGVDEGFGIAVLPFKSSGDAEMASFAVGLGEEIATSLARFRYLSVFASAAAAVDAKLGARYALEGSIRKGGSAVRVSAQLVDTRTGARLWAETYDRDLQASSIFAVQDDVAARIVATVADSYGVLVHSIRSAMRQKDDADFTPLELQLQFFAYREQITAAAHAELSSRLERALERDAGQSDVFACLAQMHVDAHNYFHRTGADTLDRALTAARRAVELDRTNQFALVALAQVHFFRRDLAAFSPTAERAMALNPLDTNAVGLLGLLIVHTGDFQRGAAIVRRAMELNPHHAGWLHFAPLWEHFKNGEYESALDRANRVDVPGFFWTYVVVASASAHLGRYTEAEAAVRDLLAIDPDFAARARATVLGWHFASGLMDPILEGLRKAGLEIPPEKGTSSTAEGRARSSATDSGAARADQGFWVAVLPFRFADAELKELADGLSEQIVTGLSRFSYLRVIARGSTAKYSGDAGDVRAIGKELGARYVMEGSLRRSGAKLRLAVQLVDGATGAHLWAENYERPFSPESVFELQDDLVPRIVSTVADMNGVLPRSMGESVRRRSAEELSSYEAVLRAFGYFARMTPEELGAAREGLDRAVQEAPTHADAWAMLALLCVQEYGQGFALEPDPLARGAAAARRAVEAGPSNPLAYFSLAQALFFEKDFQSFANAAERAVALNPMDGNAIAFVGELLTYAGEGKRGRELAARAKQLNPHHPGWYWYADFYDAYDRGEYREALGFALKANLPGHWGYQAAVAATGGQLGERVMAEKAIQALLRIRPDFAARARSDFAKWWAPSYVDSFIEGLRKAGLEIADGSEMPAAGKASGASAVGGEDAPDSAAVRSRANPAGAADAVAIAVLPFSDMSPAKDQEYLCEGMAEEIMNALMSVGGIRVASRTSAFRASQGGRDASEVGRLLSVSHVLEGSVRSSMAAPAGSRLRVTARLTDAATGFQLWSERFDRDDADIFAVQDEIAAGVVDAVKARLSPGAHAVVPRPQAGNLEAYRSYLRGRHLRGIEDHAGALRAFEEAVRLDPSHAPSWTGLAEITVLSAQFGLIPAREACATARNALSIAAGLQGESAEGCHVEAFAAFIERKWPEMEKAWRRAIALQPTHVLALGSFGIVLCARGRLDEALPLFERARQSDPLASFPYMITGGGLLEAGKPREALRYLEDALSFEKEDVSALFLTGMARVALGQFDEGIRAAEHAVAVSRRGRYFLGILGWALATAGRKDEARRILDEMRALPAGAPPSVTEALLLGALGERDAAFELLGRAEAEYQASLYYTGWTAFDALRADPRFGALRERLGLTPSPSGGEIG